MLKEEHYDLESDTEELKDNLNSLLEITNKTFEKDNDYQYYKRKIELIL